MYRVMTDLLLRGAIGFGSTWNRYGWAIGQLNGKTYVGTWSTQPDYIELGGAALGDYDQLVVAGDVDLDGTALDLSFLDGFTPSGPGITEPSTTCRFG